MVTCGWTSSEEIILAGELQFKKLQKRSLQNIQGSTHFEPVPLRCLLRAATNWATKPHVGSEVNFRGVFVALEEFDYNLGEIQVRKVFSQWWAELQCKQLQSQKNSGSDGIRTCASKILVGCHYQLIKRPHLGLRQIFVWPNNFLLQ